MGHRHWAGHRPDAHPAILLTHGIPVALTTAPDGWTVFQME